MRLESIFGSLLVIVEGLLIVLLTHLKSLPLGRCRMSCVEVLLVGLLLIIKGLLLILLTIVEVLLLLLNKLMAVLLVGRTAGRVRLSATAGARSNLVRITWTGIWRA